MMFSTETEFRCLHCDAPLRPQEIAEGWCDGCGKRVPPSIQEAFHKAKGKASLPRQSGTPGVREEFEKPSRPAVLVVFGIAVICLLGLAALAVWLLVAPGA